MKHIGIYGGSFNPPHMGHLIVCESVRSQLSLDTVIFMPSATPPHKKDLRLAPAEMRIEMTRMAIEGNPAFQVSDMEVKRGGTSYTVDTLVELQKLFPSDRLHLLIGADNWIEFDTWRTPEKILDIADVVVMTRPAFAVDRSAHGQLSHSIGLTGKNIRFVEVPQIGISGTMIRLNVKSGRSITYLVPPSVEQYIQQHALYHEKSA